MIADLLAGLVRANLAAGAAILLVLLLRRPVRAAFGARVAYVLWIAVPLAAAAVLAPQPQAPTMLSPVVLTLTGAAGGGAAAPSLEGLMTPALFALWLGGALAAAAVLLLRQARFTAGLGRLEHGAGGTFRAEHAGAGPAVIGVLRPRIVTPADFEARFDAEERRLILAHEGVHLARGDARINALAALGQCLAWFNPLTHVAVHRMRIDQELSCDAAVLSRTLASRRRYAEVLLKTQLAGQPLPLGCQWPPTSSHPLKERIIMLKSPLPAPSRRALGLVAVAAVGLGAAVSAWAAQPAAAPPLIVAPDWAQRPTGEDLAWVYPAAAKAQRLEGRATLACGVDAGGRLVDCAVASEAPAAAGFGEAALALSRSFQMKPLSKDGVATGGGSVRIPIRFILPAPPPAS